MSTLPAYAVHQDFGPETDKAVTFDRHYLLYAASGTMRLEARGRSWSLPPARAAWIAAHEPISVTIPHRITCCSALFDPEVFEAPAEPLSVFEMTPLARELILACGRHAPGETGFTAEAHQMFALLFTLARRLAARPSTGWMPAARTAAVRAALAATEAAIGEDLTLGTVASASGTGARTLARRFSDELGMTWQLARRRLRIIRAAEALAETPASVTEIAMTVGYSSSSAFNAAFRDVMGTTPTAFRTSLRNA